MMTTAGKMRHLKNDFEFFQTLSRLHSSAPVNVLSVGRILLEMNAYGLYP